MIGNLEFWIQDESYQENQAFFKRLYVVNNVAQKKRVALLEQYDKCLIENDK